MVCQSSHAVLISAPEACFHVCSDGHQPNVMGLCSGASSIMISGPWRAPDPKETMEGFVRAVQKNEGILMALNLPKGSV